MSIYDLVLGGEVRVPTMNGEVTMTIPAGTQSNKLLRLTGKGMPQLKDGGNGDQYVRLIGTAPAKPHRERDEALPRARRPAQRQALDASCTEC